MEVVRYGWYSAEAEKIYGSNYWLTPEGKEVLITASLISENLPYKWDDKVFLGIVVKWSRKGAQGDPNADYRKSLKSE